LDKSSGIPGPPRRKQAGLGETTPVPSALHQGRQIALPAPGDSSRGLQVAKPPFGDWEPAKAGFAIHSRGFSRRGRIHRRGTEGVEFFHERKETSAFSAPLRLDTGCTHLHDNDHDLN